MATMIPETIDPGTESAAERIMFDLLATLPNDYTVLHGVGLAWRDRKKRRVDGEIDFLIVHRKRGLLVLEVKGGGVAFDRRTERWTSMDRSGRVHQIENPFHQVNRAARALVDLLSRAPLTRHVNIRWGRAVVFPDVLVEGTAWGSDVAAGDVIGSEHLDDIETAIVRAYGTPHTGDDISGKVRSALIDTLKPAGEVTQLGLMSEVLGNEPVIKRLTEDQLRLLAVTDEMSHAVFHGVAGSGKTMLALEKTRRLAMQGEAVLLTCFNRALAVWMHRNVERWPDQIASLVTVQHFHDLVVTLLAEAGQPIDFTREITDTVFWESDVPSRLMQALPGLDRRFDAIVVDEGQDFTTSWWEVLRSLMTEAGTGVVYVFLDECQDLYGRERNLPWPAVPLRLTENHRNTQRITTLFNTFYDGSPLPSAIGPEGRQPEIIPVDDAGLVETVAGVLDRLIVAEGLERERIVPRSASASSLVEGLTVGAYRVSWKESPADGAIRVASVNGFKGLESDVVILAESDHFARRSRWRALWYVALSRARHHVIVLGTLSGPE